MSKGKHKIYKTNLSENDIATKRNIVTQSEKEFNFSTRQSFFIFFGLMITASFWILKDFLIGNKVFLFTDIGSDTINQIYCYAHLTIDTISKDGFPKWSFQQGLGQYVAAFNLGNIFQLITYSFGIENLPYMLGFMEFVKYVLAGTLFFFYLKTAKMSPLACILGGLAFGLSSFIIIGSTWFNFLSVSTILFAFWMLSVEKFIREGNWYLFPLAVFFVAADQPFNLFLFTEFTLIYLIVWYFFTKASLSFFVKILKMIGLGVLGVAMSAFMLGANLFVMLNSPRVSGGASLLSSLTKSPLLQSVNGFQFATIVSRFFGNNLLGIGFNYKGAYNYMEAPSFYLGLFALLLFPHMFVFLDNKKVKLAASLVFVSILFLIFPFFRNAFWAFTGDYFRISSLFIGIGVLLSALYSITKIEQGHKINRFLLLGSLIICILPLFALFTDDYEGIIVSSEKVKVIIWLLASTILIFLISFWKHWMPKVLLVLLVFIEITSVANTTINKREIVKSSDYNSKTGFNDYSVEAVEFLKNQDKSFYRIEKDYASSPTLHLSCNDPMAQGYNGTTVYTAFNHKNQAFYMSGLGMVDVKKEDQTRWMLQTRDRPFVLGNIGVKYTLSKGRIDFRNFGSDSLTAFGDVTIYQNPNYLPFGSTYDSYILESDFKKLNNLDKDFMSMKAIVLKEDSKDLIKLSSYTNGYEIGKVKEMANERKASKMDIKRMDNNHIDGIIKLLKPQMVYFSFPFDEGWKVLINGKPFEKSLVNFGLTGLMLPAGIHNIKMEYNHPYINITRPISVAGFGVFLGLIVFGFVKRSKYSKVENDK